MNAREIQRLRIKFILIAMGSLILSMLFICLLINGVELFESRREIYRILDHLIEKEGNIQDDADVEQQGNPSWNEAFAPSYRHHTYYVFFYDGQGEIKDRRISHNDSNPENMAPYASEFMKKNRDKGNDGAYYYQKEKMKDGITILAILDGRAIILSRFRLQVVSIAVVISGMILSLILVIAFSGKAIRPEIENSIRQDQFITNASHELKTPLAVIRSNTEMEELIRGESEWTQSTIRQVDRLTGLIQNLVMISKAREQENKSGLSEIDASDIVKDAVDTFEVVAVQDGKKVEKQIDDNIRLLADGSAIRQLTTILMDNAAKYCDPGGVIKVVLHQGKRNKGLNLTVSNSYKDGKDIDYRRFFDRFYREESHHNIDKGGYGIGLSIAKTICQQYGGQIKADWKNGEISFICTLY